MRPGAGTGGTVRPARRGSRLSWSAGRSAEADRGAAPRVGLPVPGTAPRWPHGVAGRTRLGEAEAPRWAWESAQLSAGRSAEADRPAPGPPAPALPGDPAGRPRGGCARRAGAPVGERSAGPLAKCRADHGTTEPRRRGFARCTGPRGAGIAARSRRARTAGRGHKPPSWSAGSTAPRPDGLGSWAHCTGSRGLGPLTQPGVPHPTRRSGEATSKSAQWGTPQPSAWAWRSLQRSPRPHSSSARRGEDGEEESRAWSIPPQGSQHQAWCAGVMRRGPPGALHFLIRTPGSRGNPPQKKPLPSPQTPSTLLSKGTTGHSQNPQVLLTHPWNHRTRRWGAEGDSQIHHQSDM